MDDVLQNKVANSGIVSLDLEKYLPVGEAAYFDLKGYLFMGLILKEKDFRQALKDTDWTQYTNKNVAVYCSADAIIPVWAYMLVVSYLQPVAATVFAGTEKEMQKFILLKNLSAINAADFADQRVVIKGCGEVQVDYYAYAEITRLLLPFVKSIMYGEPCSTVPIYKRK